MDGAVDFELQEETVGAGCGERRHELEAVGVGVDVEVGEVALPQRDQVPVGAEVVLQLYGPAVVGDAELELGLLARPRGALV